MSQTITDITVNTIEGTARSFSEYQGQVLLIVNVASRCGYTPQYNDLEALQAQYGDRGFRVLGFPCNDFGAQEPGTNQEILEFCTVKYGVTFEMFDKVHAKGPEQHPLYTRLTSAATPTGDVAWNFEKFLIGKTGEIVARFPSGTKPNDPVLTAAIEKELAA